MMRKSVSASSPFTDITSRSNNSSNAPAQSPFVGTSKRLSFSQSTPETLTYPPTSQLPDDMPTIDDIVEVEENTVEKSNSLSARQSVGGSRSVGMGNGISVAVRVRPFTEVEIKEKVQAAVTQVGPNILRLAPPEGSHAQKLGKESVDFEFGRVFLQDSTQESVYDGCAKHMVDSLFEQQSSLLFVYGVSNSGKTFTISGPKSHPGVIPLALRDVFAKIEDCKDDFEVRVSFFEFYIKNEVYDLLSSSSSDDDKKSSAKKPANTRLSKGGKESASSSAYGKCINGKIIGNAIMFPGLTESVVSDVDHALRLLEAGTRRKHVEATSMNAASSRSHSVFSIKLARSRAASHASGLPPMSASRASSAHTIDDSVIASMNIVDLAGVERHKKAALSTEPTDCLALGSSANAAAERERIRRVEASNINQSLMSLGAVLRSLSDRNVSKAMSAAGLPATPSGTSAASSASSSLPFQRGNHFIFYVQMLLQQAGPGLITMITNVSPGTADYDEKVKVLEYASVAKRCVVPETPVLARSNSLSTPGGSTRTRRSLMSARSTGNVKGSAQAHPQRRASDEEYGFTIGGVGMTFQDVMSKLSQMDEHLQQLTQLSLARNSDEVSFAQSPMNIQSKTLNFNEVAETDDGNFTFFRRSASSSSIGNTPDAVSGLDLTALSSKFHAAMPGRRSSAASASSSAANSCKTSPTQLDAARQVSGLAPSMVLSMNLTEDGEIQPGSDLNTATATAGDSSTESVDGAWDAQMSAEDLSEQQEVLELLASGDAQAVQEKVALIQYKHRCARSTALIVHRIAEAQRRRLAFAFHRLRTHALETASSTARANYESLTELMEIQRETQCACQRVVQLVDRAHRRDMLSKAMHHWRLTVEKAKHAEAMSLVHHWTNEAEMALKAVENLDEALTSLQNQHGICAHALSEKEQQLSEQLDQLSQLSTMLQNTQKELAEAESERQRDHDTIDELANQHSETVNRHEEELQGARALYDQLSKSHEALQQEIERLSSELLQISQLRDKLQEQIDTITCELENVRQLVASKEQQLQSLAQANAEQIKAMEYTHAQVIITHTQQISELLSSSEILKSQLSELTFKLQSQTAEADAELTRRHTIIEFLQNQTTQQADQILALQQEITSFQSSTTELEAQLFALTANAEVLSTKLRDACAEQAASNHQWQIELRETATRVLDGMLKMRAVKSQLESRQVEFGKKEDAFKLMEQDHCAERVRLIQQYEQLQAQEEKTIQLLHCHQAELETQRQELIATRQLLETSQAESQAALSSVQFKLADAQGVIISQNDIIIQQKQSIEMQTLEISTNLQRIAELETRIKSLEVLIAELHSQRQRLEHQSEALQERLEALVTSHADELLETKQQHSIVMQEMQNTVDSLMASHARIQSAQAADIERARAETLSIQAEAVALKEQISELDLQLVQAQDLQASTASERQQALAEVSELKSALAACQQEYSECQARADALIVQLNEKLAAAEARAESEARARALVDAELRAQADSLQALMEMSKSKEAEAEALLNQKEGALMEHLAQMKSLQHDLEERIKLHEFANASHECQVQSWTNERGELQQRLHETQAELASVHQQRESLQQAITSLESELTAARENYRLQVDTLRAQFSKAAETNELEAQNRVDEMRRTADAAQQLLCQQLQTLRDSHASLQKQLDLQITEMNWSEERHGAEKAQLEAELKESQARLNVHLGEIQQLQDERRSLNLQLFQSMNKNEPLNSEISSTRQYYQLAVDKLQKQSLEQHRIQLEARCTMMDQLWKSSMTCRQLRAQIEQLKESAQQEQNQWSEKYISLESRERLLSSQLSNKEKQISELQIKLRTLQSKVMTNSAMKQRREDKLREEKEELLDRAEELECEKESLEADLSKTRAELNEIRLQLDREAQQHSEHVNALQKQVSDFRQQLEAAETKAALDLQERRRLIESRDAEIHARRELERQCEQLQQQLRQQQMEMASWVLRSMLSKRESDAKNLLQINSLREQCEEAVKQASDQLLEHQQQIEKMASERQHIQSDAATALAQKEQDLQKYVAQTRALQRRLKEADEKCRKQSTEHSQNVAEAQRTRDALQVEVEALTQEIADLQMSRQNQLDDWQNLLNFREAELESSKRKCEDMQTSLQLAQQSQQDELQRLTTQFENEVNQYRKTISTTQELHASEQQNVQRLHDELSNLQSKHAELRDQALQRQSVLEAQLSNVQEELTQYQLQLLQARQERESVMKEMQMFVAEFSKPVKAPASVPQVSASVSQIVPISSTIQNEKQTAPASDVSEKGSINQIETPVFSSAGSIVTSSCCQQHVVGEIEEKSIAVAPTPVLVQPAAQAASFFDLLGMARKAAQQTASSVANIPDALSLIWFKDVTVAPAWQHDSDRDDCTICLSKFGFFFNRRHHCRACGFLFCGDCSSRTMPIPHNFNQVERVCDICLVKVRFHYASGKK